MFKKFNLHAVIAVALFAFAGQAQASAGGGGGLPMEAPIQKLQQSLTGPIAFGVALCAIVAAFGAIIFLGHQMGDLVRTLLFIVIGISVLAAAPTFMSSLGIAGATIGKEPSRREVRPDVPAVQLPGRF
jgi:type IV secretory pathway VirB2 component (pilin)